MKVLAQIDQAECLRRGIDAPNSTELIELVPSELTERERGTLADGLRDGHRWEEGASRRRLVGTGIDALRAELARIHAAEDREAIERAELHAAAVEAFRAVVEAELGSEELPVKMMPNGSISHAQYDNGAVAERVVVVPTVRSLSDFAFRGMPDDLTARYRERVAAVEAATKAAIESVLPELRAELTAFREEQAAAEARRQAEYDALYARLPESMRRRDEAGFADRDEIRTAISKLIRSDQYPDYVPTPRNRLIELRSRALTDEQFAAWETIRAGAPEGARIDLVERSDVEYREAIDDDDPDDIDDDGEIGIVRNRVVSARVRWSRGGVEARAYFNLPA